MVDTTCRYNRSLQSKLALTLSESKCTAGNQLIFIRHCCVGMGGGAMGTGRANAPLDFLNKSEIMSVCGVRAGRERE